MGTRSTHIPADELLAIVAAARRAGRYDPAARRLCDRCLEWVDEIVHVTIDRKRICPACLRGAVDSYPGHPLKFNGRGPGRQPCKPADS
jgi:hypothetical protein